MSARFSPMLEQYFELKSRYPEAILLMRVGDFYEAYGDDAETISRALSIALTSKEAGSGQRVAMAGVPHHALDAYLAKLVVQRYVVALGEQMETPVPNKLTARDVVRVVTPGTLIEEQLLERSANNYLAAITALGDVFAVAHADVSTGYLAATAFSGDTAFDEVMAELHRLGPVEIVADVPPDVRQSLAAALEYSGARITSPAIALVGQACREPVEGFSFDESVAMARAVDALRAFVRRVGVSTGDALRAPSYYTARQFMALDANTRKHLELTKALGANSKATLLATVDKTRTAMGSRLLARWITQPLVEREQIGARADAVEALLRDATRRMALQDVLYQCFDLERIAQKVRYRRAGPRDCASLRRTLALLDPLRDGLTGAAETLPPLLHEIAARIGTFDDVLDDLRKSLVDEPPATLADGGAIRPDCHAELAECVNLRTDTRTRIAELEERERSRTGIKALKVKYASAFGYAIEVSKSNLAMVPTDYVRRQTLANGERFVTPELRELDIAISSAQTRQLKLEVALFEELIERLAARCDDILAAAGAIAELDACAGLAQVAGERGYVRPAFAERSSVQIVDGRHPVMEALIGPSFVPNDLRLDPDRARFMLLTGPNMGGKSTFLRQAALIVILAQIGSFVPAKSASLGIVDRIFTRIGAGDDLASGQSTFYVEMAETANILRRATHRSLLLIDEVGRGTGTIDGLAIAQAICEYLLERQSQSPMVLFATHFHELVSLAERWPVVANYHITAVENTSRAGAPVFSHRVLPGSSSRSFGIEVARMAGLPPSVVGRAKEIAEVLSGRPTLETQVPLRGRLSRADGDEQLQLGL